jgi:gas vesicle protein
VRFFISIKRFKEKFIPQCQIRRFLTKRGAAGIVFFNVILKQTIKKKFMNSTGKVLLAIIGAAAAGAIIGMLVAPEKGTDLRRRISETTGDWASQLSDLLAQGKEQLQNFQNKATNEGENLANEAGDRFNKVREKVS